MLDVLGLGSEAESVYRLLLTHPRWGVRDLVEHLAADEDTVRGALDQLFDLALLRPSAEREGELRAVSPTLGLQSLLARQQADVEHRLRRIAAGQAAVAAILAEYSDQAAEEAPEAERVVGPDAIQSRLEELALTLREELLSIVPSVPSVAAAETARRHNAELVARGITIRTSLRDSARRDPVAAEYAKSLTDVGAEVRTAPLLPPRMLIFDRAIAIVPIDPGHTAQGVLQLSGLGVVASLVTLYEQVWRTAVPLGAVARDSDGITPIQRELLQLLAQGHTDSSAATRLGLSERTCRRAMAELMERLGARSRFEAGLLAAREGWI
ncbi:helix-turn-helix transcriptional regulator [Actinoplanes hulinensis]|uniref:Helix-turn-helix transcriptional regulator n=1 Tax=Actinoplanes hulinensis TaxID=1144547 RepID=A0ABS7AWK4_9ACTN|nr:helix-turn-helix transcriptional regulator [Actinoplanes hulinensis]MBW6432473.1 helix-turn-helix transcriptional regulator [Actinoplanes hulinensis]